MGYESAMRAAGANVLAFRHFGSYQGEWWALVEFEGKKGFVSGWYGSCEMCDAFQMEFGYSYDKPNYEERLAEFGRSYLDNIKTQESAIESASDNLSWDMEAESMVAWLKGFHL